MVLSINVQRTAFSLFLSNRLALPILFLLTLSAYSVRAQPVLERFKADAEMLLSASSDKNQSFWLVSNRNGVFDDTTGNALLRGSLSLDMDTARLFDVGGGVNLVGKAAPYSTAYLHEAWLETKVGFVNLLVGRKRVTYGHTYQELTTGSTGLSQNARPLQRVTASVDDFYTVPFTNGWLEFKGHFSHGWLDDERDIKDAYLHDKSLYFQTGGDAGYKIYGGLVHFALWGGESESKGKQPTSFSDFIRVVLSKEGGGDALTTDQLNALGFHTGLYDMGVHTTVGGVDLHIYYQHFFTDRSGMEFQNWRDGLYGVGIKDPFQSRYITGFLWEFLYSKDQSGPGVPDSGVNDVTPFCDEVNCGYPYRGRDNYYNNSVYRSGFSYLNRSLGTPLFFTNDQLDQVDPDVRSYTSGYFVSNRVASHHFGVMGEATENIHYRLFATHVSHYGTYQGLNFAEPWGSKDPDRNQEDYFFYPAQKQWHFMLETQWMPKSIDQLSVNLTLAADRGELFNNFGVMGGVRWALR